MKIVKLTKTRAYFDDDLVYDVNYDLIAIYRLKEGLDLPFDLFREFLYESCLLKGYKLIARREYSKKELKTKLIFIYRKEDIVERVIGSFLEKGYIDDYSYAINYVKSKKQGRNKTEYELKLKGISSENIRKAFNEAFKDEKEEIRAQLHKVKNKDYRKKVEYFMRRGYSLEDILDIIKK